MHLFSYFSENKPLNRDFYFPRPKINVTESSRKEKIFSWKDSLSFCFWRKLGYKMIIPQMPCRLDSAGFLQKNLWTSSWKQYLKTVTIRHMPYFNFKCLLKQLIWLEVWSCKCSHPFASKRLLYAGPIYCYGIIFQSTKCKVNVNTAFKFLKFLKLISIVMHYIMHNSIL